MPITNQPNLAALQAAIVQAITDSQTAVIANSDSNAAAVVMHVTDETGAAATALTAEITETQTAVAATQAAVEGKGVIKTIQRGAVVVSTASGEVVVNISEVNMAKSQLLAAWNNTAGVRVRFISSTQIALTTATASANTTEWQVVEYE